MVKTVDRGPLDIVPLGGLGEFGLNMMTYRHGDTMLVVDAGIMFPGPEHPGVNILLPDTRYLEEHRDVFRGIVLTHAHEDHIGALPQILKQFKVPVYGTKLTLGMVRRKLVEHELDSEVELHEISPGESFSVGSFGTELVSMTHSLADAVAVILDTPQGKIVHTGDFKVDEAPPIGPPIDLKRLAQIGKEGVLCMLSDSTNAEVAGRTGNESSVADAIKTLITEAPGRVLFSCFTSSTHRIQIALDVAAKLGRKVALVGRSMVENTHTAMDLGYMKAPAGLIRTIEEFDQVPRNKQLFITAGSQGEPFSALAQVANDTHRYISIEPGDRVLLSARVIPGNTRSVNRVVNGLHRLGADVFQPGRADIHVSGHASAEDLDMVLRLVQPESFVPIHGEWRQLFHHAKIARDSGVDPDAVFLAEDGDVLRFDEGTAMIVDHFDTQRELVDVSGLGLVDDCVVRDRRRLSAAGVVVPMLSLTSKGTPIVSDILSRGFVDNENAEVLLSEAHDIVLDAVRSLSSEESGSEQAVQDLVKVTLKRFFRKKGIRRPVILPVVVEAEEE